MKIKRNLKKMSLLVFIVIITMPLYLVADKLEYIINIEEPIIVDQYFANDLNVLQTTGYPMIPYINICILLPMGEKLNNITVNFFGDEKIIGNVFIKPSQGYFTSSKERRDPDKYSNIYNENAFIPQERYSKGNTQILQGHYLFYVSIIPYQFNPVNQQLKWQNNCKIVVKTVYDSTIEDKQNIMLTNDPETNKIIQNIVINPEIIDTYHKDINKCKRTKESLVDPENPYDMIIITKNDWVTLFDEYIDWREANCNSYLLLYPLEKIGIFTKEDIYANYDGIDNADKIRNFVIDAYQTYASVDYGLRYLILGGDSEIIPTRNIYCFSEDPLLWDDYVECDTYYGGLDGTWDSNGDGIYEATSDNDEIDSFPEVRVGRIPVSNVVELQNFLNKTINYCSPSSNHFIFVGEELAGDPVNGEDYCEQVYDIIDDNCEDLVYTKLYNGESVNGTINSGFGFLHHFGHSNFQEVMGISNPNTLTNSDRGLIISNGCHSAEFSWSDAIGEEFVFAPNGAYAYIGNTSYGWYTWWWTPSGYAAGGPGIHMAKIFAYYSTFAGWEKRSIGLSLNLAKYIAYCDMPCGPWPTPDEEDIWLWQIVEMNLLGDPSLMLPSYFMGGGNLPSAYILENQVILVYGDLNIPNGNTIHMAPGSQLIFVGHYGLNIEGTLIAEGSEENMIKFTGPSEIGWKGLSFNETLPENSSCLIYCRIENGKSNGICRDDRYPPDPLYNGGGIFVKDYDNLIIENCIIQNNHANHGGGGIYLYNSDITIQNCIIKDNTADPNPYPYPYEKGGGGIHCELSSPEIINCVIDNNNCYVGGGVCLYNLSYPTFKYNLISNNYGAKGGAIFFKDSSPAIINNTISYNDAYLGVIYCKSNSDPTFKNCILWDNIGYEVHLYNEDSDPNFYYCDIEGGLGSIYGPYVTYTGNYENNIDEDPLFVDPNNEDFHLTADSPCIDAGDPSSPPDPDETIVDMGTYYFHQIGIIEGNVSLSGGNGNVEDVEVTAGGITVNPDGSGYYYIELYVGTYDVRASLPAYNFPTANGIVVENGTTTTVNLTLDYTSIIFVSQDENWHFRKIQDGIDAAQDGERVYVDDGIYDDEILLNGRGITVRSIYGPTNCIIDSDCIGFIFFNEDYSTIEGFTIIYAVVSLIIEQSSPTINNCKMIDSGTLYISDGSSPVITNCTITGGIWSTNSSLEISNCQINGVDGGIGISSMQNCSTIITNCEITNYTIGALQISGGSTIIDGCIISNNVVRSGGVPIINIHESLTTISNCEIVNNIVCGAFCESKTISCTGSSSELYLSNCTLSGNDTQDNDYSIYLDDGAIGTITNCILWDDVTDQQIWPLSCADVSYCDIKTDYPGYYPDHCIFEDPYFVDPANGNYSLIWDSDNFSPCIDAGDPNSTWDPDNTPPDMGAIPAVTHDYFYDQYDGCELDQIDWISFPALNRTTNGYTEALGLLQRQELIDDDNEFNDDILDHVVFEDENAIHFASGQWQNNLPPDGDFYSKQGYKIVLQEGYTSADIGISGTWEDESEPIQLYANKENWVGCYLEEPATLEDAFESIWDEWISITSEHWGIIREWEEEQIRSTVNPGELYIINVENDCELIWNESSPPVPPYRKEMTDYFAYEEKLDYMPVNVDTVYGDTTVVEIGVFYEDECIGASKVTDGYPVQILAYTPESGSKDGSNGLQFMLYYESSKNKAKVVTNYTVFNRETSAFVNKPVYYDRDDFVRVRLNTEGHQPEYEFALMNNYPNPVNTGKTNISFAPAKDAINTEIQIFNIKGQLVRKLDCNEVACKNGGYIISWDCRNENGIKVSSGIYFYKLISDNKTAVKKMLVIH